MREIKFRGKTEAGEWIIGDLVNIDGDKYILADKAPDSIDRYKVDPETVGQFTGLKDKNGNDIFEGDIFTFDSTGLTLEIKYEHNSFDAYDREDNMIIDLKWFHGSLNVIGNIHDNPELL